MGLGRYAVLVSSSHREFADALDLPVDGIVACQVLTEHPICHRLTQSERIYPAFTPEYSVASRMQGQRRRIPNPRSKKRHCMASVWLL